jgi:hypothetical protein
MNPQYILTMAMLFATNSVAMPSEGDSAIEARDSLVCCQSGSLGSWGSTCATKFDATFSNSYLILVSLAQ